ncbi:MAG: four helix bundle protein [Patescibacteria group bacterium]
MIKDFHDLKVYNGSKTLFVDTARICQSFPNEGRYLKSQILRAGNSIHANIAEGFGRSEAEFRQYLTRSLGSNNEIISHLEDAYALGYISQKDFKNLSDGYTVLGKQIYQLKTNWKTFS